MSTTFIKDPDAVEDYEIDWSTWLGTDVISTSTWIIPDGLTLVDDPNNTTVAVAWISGGSLGNTYVITNRITTVAGRTNDQSLTIKIRSK